MPGRQRQPEPDGIWRSHLGATRAFLAVAGQWHTAVLPGTRNIPAGRVIWLGLDYTAAHAGLALAGMELDPETWAAVRLIEVGAIEELNREH